MNKVAFLALLICWIALCIIGGYFPIAEHGPIDVKTQSLSEGKLGFGALFTSQPSAAESVTAETVSALDTTVNIQNKNLRVENPPSTVYQPITISSAHVTPISTPRPSEAPKPQPPKPPAMPSIVSIGKPVTSDVRGNLGPASVVTNEAVEDWLKDRWQAARNMGGDPIPGEHWVEVDLQGLYHISKLMIDWEVAFSADYSVKVKNSVDEPYLDLCSSAHIASSTHPNKMHSIQTVAVPAINTNVPARFVRLVIHRPGTRFGSSIWRFHVWGVPAV